VSNIQEPTKKKAVSDQSIPVKDRIQATIRNLQYQVDLSEYNKNFVDYISKLPEDIRPREDDYMQGFIKDNPVAKKWNLPFLEFPFVFHHQTSHDSIGDNQCSCEVLEGSRLPCYIDIRVYLEAPFRDIQKDVMDYVNYFQEAYNIKNRTPRQRKGVDMWKVYDMKTRDNKTIMEVARALWPEEELCDSINDSNTKNKWEQISRAIKTSTQLVQRVEKEAAKNKVSLHPHRNMYKNFL